MTTDHAPLSEHHHEHRTVPHVGLKVCGLVILTIILPAFLTLRTVDRPRPLMSVHDNPSPLGYTWSLTLFVIPVIVLAWWFGRHPLLASQRRAFWLTIAVLVPIGALLDLLLGCAFFTFENHHAVLGVWVPARGGHVPIEEFGFYTFGFLAILMTYIWCDEYFLEKYNIPDYKVLARDVPRVVQLYWPALGIGAVLAAAAIGFKRGLSAHPEGLPGYMLFLIGAAIVPTLLLYRAARPFLNWRALTFTYFLLLLVSLLWEATIAVPYRWWGYKDAAMTGIFIGPWSNLPIEEPILWSVVTFATVNWYEAMKVFLAMEGTNREALFGKRKPPPTAASR